MSDTRQAARDGEGATSEADGEGRTGAAPQRADAPVSAEGHDTAIVLPVMKDLTYNEIHSALLGLVGVLAGVGFQAGYREVVVGFTVLVVTIAFGLRRLSGERVPIARRLIRREPWYFLTVYVATAVAVGVVWTGGE